MARARALDPERYGDKKTITHRGTITHAAANAWTISAEDMNCLNDAETDALISILGKVRKDRTGEKQAALEYEPSDVIDADFEPVENWSNSFSIFTGADYHINDSNTFRFGVALDQSPVDRSPVDRR